jgi:hypothetical protein
MQTDGAPPPHVEGAQTYSAGHASAAPAVHSMLHVPRVEPGEATLST